MPHLAVLAAAPLEQLAAAARVAAASPAGEEAGCLPLAHGGASNDNGVRCVGALCGSG